MKRPFVWLTVSLSCGIAGAHAIPLPFEIAFVSAAISFLGSIVFFRRSFVSWYLSLGAVFFLGVALIASTQILPPNHISRHTPRHGRIDCSLEGTITSDPSRRSRTITYEFAAERLFAEGTAVGVTGTVLVRSYRLEAFSYGERLVIHGSLGKPPILLLSQRTEYREILRRSGIYAMFTVTKKDDIERLGMGTRNPVKAFAFTARNAAKKKIDELFIKPYAAILNALILGIQQEIPRPIRDMFVRTGTVHILSVSGLHVGIIAFMIFMVLRAIGISDRISCIASIPFVILYCLLTGSQVPVVRSTVMAVTVLIGYALRREQDMYNTLSFAALVILLANPWQLFSVSFQLSFVSVLSIVRFEPTIQALFPERIMMQRSLRSPVVLFSVSCAAWLGTLPLVGYYFGIVTPIALLSNIVIVPYMSVVMASACTYIASSFLAPSVRALFAASCQLSTELLLVVVSFFSKIPGAYFYYRSMNGIFVGVYYLLLIICVTIYERHNSLEINKLRNIS